MKITQRRSDGKKQTQRLLELEVALAAMRTETKEKPVSAMRERLPYAVPNERMDYVQKLPVLLFGCALHKSSSGLVEMEYNGCVTLEINRLTGLKEAAEVRKQAAGLPQTLISFIGSSGRSVKIVVPFVLPDDSLPHEPEKVEMFHAHAYRKAVQYYQPQLNREIDLKAPSPDQSCRLSFDPQLYYNPQAEPIRMEQPMKMPEEPTFEEKQEALQDPLMRLIPGYERSHIIATLFETSLYNALERAEASETREDNLPFFTRLAENCHASGIPEEDAVRWSLLHRNLRDFEVELRATFRSTYTLRKRFGNKPCIPAPMTLILQLDEFMQRRYQFRRNTMKGVTEYRPHKSFYFNFRPVTKQAMNSIALDAQGEGLAAWDADVKRYVESDRIPNYNPVEEYLGNLKPWDGKDRIRELAGRVPCEEPAVWQERFHTWFLSMVAHWRGIDKKHANSALPLLIGDQGCGKSTFCLNLLPPALREYYTDSIDFSNRRNTELALNRYLLINMDEFDSISPAYQGFMKHIVQKAVVQSRRPYGTVTEELRRYATFIATSNNFDLLNDPTGSRRYICVEVKGIIDYRQPVNHEQLYAQAMEELSLDTRYWFTHEEEAAITRDNQRFRQVSMVEESCLIYFRQPVPGERFEELTAVEMLERVKDRQKGFKYTPTMVLKLGRVLRTMFESRRVHRGFVYKVLETN